MEDKALHAVNKKSWTKTRPIMVCNAINFWLLLGIVLNRWLEYSFSWFVVLSLSALIFTALSLAYASEIESQL